MSLNTKLEIISASLASLAKNAKVMVLVLPLSLMMVNCMNCMKFETNCLNSLGEKGI